MDYLQEIKLFYDWIITNPIHSDAQSLWHLLMNIRCKSVENKFTVTNKLILTILGISNTQLDRARNQLKQSGRITYQKRSGSIAGIYGMVDFVHHYGEQMRDKPDTNVRQKPTVKPKGNPATKPVLAYYQKKFQAKFNESPIIDYGKDGALIKSLLSTYGEDKLKGLIDVFFESDDQFIKSSGYTIGVFKTVINKLLINNKSLKDKAAIQDDDWYLDSGGRTSGTG
jgi:hypothetical protein